MKLFVLTTTLLLSVSSFAQEAGKPFFFPPGKYSESCYSTQVHKNADGEIQRFTDESKGTVESKVIGDVFIETATINSGDFSQVTITRTEVTDLGNSLFKQDVTSTSTYTLNDTVKTKTTSYVTNVKVEENTTINQSVIQDGKERKNLVGETAWNKLKDGRIVVYSYQREPTEMTKIVNNQPVSYTSISANSTCLYRKVK